ncbi:MAG: hypothetical protein KF729_00095 [Sandaracinaceae bacterium]|nr:hypothetical protein [Sandaracinaceae bacterium]
MKTTMWMPSAWLGGLLLVLAACDGGGGGDAGPMNGDAGPMNDDAGPVGHDAGPMNDAGPPPECEPACGAGEICLRSVCVATCGADASGWDGALAADLAPVRVFCRSASSFGTQIDGTTTIVRDLVATASATGTDLVVSEWEAALSATPTATVLAMASVVHDAETFLFPGGYVAGARGDVVFGYTLSDAGFSGEILHVGAGGALTRLAAPGNFDAARAAAGRFLLNGLGLEGAGDGQALYVLEPSGPRAARVVTGVGSFSGGVALESEYVLVGGLDDSFVGHVYAIGRAALDAAAAGGAPIADPREATRADGGPLGSAFALVHGAIVVPRYDAMFALEALERHPVLGWSEADGLDVGVAADLTSGGTFSAAHPAAGGRTLLQFGAGLLLVE